MKNRSEREQQRTSEAVTLGPQKTTVQSAQGHRANDALSRKGDRQSAQALSENALGYEPFGSLLPGRNYSSSNYRWGFNGAEKDDEVHGSTGTSYNFGSRILDPRIGRWLSMDPYATSYPDASPYGFAANSPLMFVDPDGQRLRFSLAMRLFHRQTYKAVLTYVRSASGREIYRQFATGKQAQRLWGDNGGDGALAKNNDAVFIHDKTPGGETEGQYKVDGKWVSTQSLTEAQVNSMHANTQGRVNVLVGTDQEVSRTADNPDGVVTGDQLRIILTAGHESTQHTKMEALFMSAIGNGAVGADLNAVLGKIFPKGVDDAHHAAAANGYNGSFNRFIDWFKGYARENGATEGDLKEMLDFEDMYNSVFKEEFQKAVDDGKVDPKTFE